MNSRTSLHAVPSSPETAVAPIENGAKPRSSRERPNGEREALLRFATAAAGASDLDELLELAAAEALAALDAAALSISKFEDDESLLRTMINVGTLSPIEEPRPDDETYEVADFPRLAEMARDGKPYFNSLDDPDCDPASAALLRKLEKTSDLSVAIHGEDGLWGTLWAATDAATSTFRGEDVRFLEAMAGQLGAAISRAELFSRVSRLAYEDPLTGLANRRAFDERLERAVRRYGDDGKSLTLLLCDLDRLKAINDVHGHAAGDRALISTGEALVAAAADHPGSFVARLAGDEFCVLVEGRTVPSSGEETATVEAIGAAAQQLLAEDELPATLSCGAVAAGRDRDARSDAERRRRRPLRRQAPWRRPDLHRRRGGLRRRSPARSLLRRLARGPDRGWRARRSSSGSMASLAMLRCSIDSRWSPSVTPRPPTSPAGRSRSRSTARPTCATCRSARTASGRLRASASPAAPLQYELYELDDFPATAEIIAAGTGSIAAHLDDPTADPAEREQLADQGLVGVVGATAGDGDGVYLLEFSPIGRTLPSPRSSRPC